LPETSIPRPSDGLSWTLQEKKMGFEDRDYYREAPRGLALKPTSAVSILIIANVVIWLAQVAFISQGFIEKHFACHPMDVFEHHEWWQILTANFLHAPDKFGHILFNMLCLFIFGRELESTIGRRDFLVFYICAGTAAILAEALIDYSTGTRGAVILGASGAVMGTVVLFTLFSPQRPLYPLGLPIPIQAWLLCTIFVLLDLSGALGGAQGIAHWAHLGGAAFAVVYKLLDLRWDTLRSRWNGLSRSLRWRTPRKRIPRLREPEPSLVQSPPRPRRQAHDSVSARIDEILEKISRSGRESLSEEELEFLLRNSGRYRSEG